MTQLSKALLSLTQDGQKGIPPCYGEKSLCCLRAKDKRRSIFLHFTCDKIVLNFRSYLDIVGNSSCYQIAEKRQYANWSQNSKWLLFPWPKGSRLVWEWPQRAIAFSKGFMRRQRTDKRSLILLQLIPYTRPKCTAKESVMKGFWCRYVSWLFCPSMPLTSRLSPVHLASHFLSHGDPEGHFPLFFHLTKCFRLVLYLPIKSDLSASYFSFCKCFFVIFLSRLILYLFSFQ